MYTRIVVVRVRFDPAIARRVREDRDFFAVAYTEEPDSVLVAEAEALATIIKPPRRY